MERLLKLWKKEKRLVAGIMSGTSLDGIDVALVTISGSGIHSRIKPVAFKTIDYDQPVRQKILEACRQDTSDVALICSLNFTLGELFAKAVIKVCNDNGINVAELDLIGSHGQTIWHCPGHSTLQIGEAAVIAERTGVVTVADFRVRDIAAGGHGAPLVPYTDYLLYRDAGKTRLLQNIGGIANVTVLPAGGGAETVTGFDNGPGNMMIDDSMRIVTNGRQQFDRGGETAGRGKADAVLLKELMTHPYLSQLPPKTTGREMFGEKMTAGLVAKYRMRGVSNDDIVATFTLFTAKSIADSYRRFILPQVPIDEVIVSGGGSHNRTLLAMLRQELAGIPVRLQEELGFSSDAKEAVAFAVLANETIHGRVNSLAQVTGAGKPVVMGKISL